MSDSNEQEKFDKIIKALKKDPSLFDDFKTNPEETLKRAGIPPLTKAEIKALREAAGNLTPEQLQERISNMSYAGLFGGGFKGVGAS